MEDRILNAALDTFFTGKPFAGDDFKESDWRRLYEVSEKQGITALVFSALSSSRCMPYEIYRDFFRSSQRTVISNDRLIFETARQVRLLLDSGIGCAVLKGAAMASYYPSPVIRRSGDIDIYVRDKKFFDKACCILEQNGLVREKKSYSLHHVAFTGEGGIETELHSSLLEPFDDERANRLIEEFEKHLSFSWLVIRDGLSLPAISEKDNGVYLCLHLLSHFLGEGISLRQMIDISVLFNHMSDQSEMDFFLRFMSRAGLLRFALTVTGLCQRKLFLSPEKNPMRSLDRDYDEKRGKDLFRMIMESGDFGAHGAERMVVPERLSVKAFMDTFLAQVKRNYPDEYVDTAKRPILCLKTLCGFIKNNRNVRGVSTCSVIKDAFIRGKEAGEFDIFKDCGIIRKKATGNSMWPFIHDGDLVCIDRNRTDVKVYDIILYRRKDGRLVLHRVVDIRQGVFICAGDNQTVTEQVTGDMICGKLIGFYHDGRYIKAGDLRGRVYAMALPLRRTYREIKHAVKR